MARSTDDPAGAADDAPSRRLPFPTATGGSLVDAIPQSAPDAALRAVRPRHVAGLAGVSLLHLFGGLTWLGAFGLGIGEATPADESTDRPFYIGLGVGAVAWLAVAGLIVRQWRHGEPIWALPLMWWIPTLVIAFIAAYA